MNSICIGGKRTALLSFILFLMLTAPVARGGDLGPPFDPVVPGMNLVKLVSGTEALQAINKLHGLAIPMKAGFIAHYGDTQGKATIWVSEAPTVAAGEEQIDVMIEKMKDNPRSPFRKYEHATVNDVPIIRFHGMGQIHAVFQLDAWVYWISAYDKDMNKLLTHLCQNEAQNPN